MTKLPPDRATIFAGLVLIITVTMALILGFYVDSPPNPRIPKCETSEIPIMNTEGWWCVPARRVK